MRDSVKFYRDCRRVLGEVGVLAVNLFGRHESFGKNIDNLSKAFDDRVILLPEIDAGNQIVLAFSGRAWPAELLGRAAIVEARYGLPARALGASVDGARRGRRVALVSAVVYRAPQGRGRRPA